MTRLALVLDALRASFWFLPTVMTIVASGLAVGLVLADRALGDETIRGAVWLYAGAAEGARSLLSAVAGAMVTVVGVAFSVTVVSLQLASAQLGPRVLRNFRRDRGNQVVLGTFVATFVYCLLVLRTVRGSDGLTNDTFVPHLAVTGGVALAVVSAGVLIYFIHHAAVAIQADHVIAAIAHELDGVIDALYPEPLGADDRGREPPARFPTDVERHARRLAATATGYVQSIDADRLLTLASAHDLLVRIELAAGDFVIAGEPLARAWPSDHVDDERAAQIAAAVALGDARTLVQDVRFGFQQLVEVAIRALSSGVRDPATATRCVDRLGAALARVADRRLEPPSRREHGRLRVLLPAPTLSELTSDAFDALCSHAAGSAAVSVRLLDTFARLARHHESRELHVALLRQTVALERAAHDTLASSIDRRAIDARAARVRRALRPDVVTDTPRLGLERPA
jgi:uncharacterized membrane protein